MYDWIVFKPGSYWIYIDSITGVYDSIAVSDVLLDTSFFHNENRCVEQRNEEIHVLMKSYYNNKEIELIGRYNLNSGVTNNPNPVRGVVNAFDKKHSGGDGGYSNYMFFPVLQGTMGYAFGPIIHDTIYNSYEVLGNSYSNVLRVYDRDNGAYNAITKFYHAKHIGVIRKEIYEWKPRHDNSDPKLLHVWELADYKVSQ